MAVAAEIEVEIRQRFVVVLVSRLARVQHRARIHGHFPGQRRAALPRDECIRDRLHRPQVRANDRVVQTTAARETGT